MQEADIDDPLNSNRRPVGRRATNGDMDMEDGTKEVG
jgi:hypothetical protein